MKETEFKLQFENFYCPITGQHVLDPGQFNPSPAMVFLFLHPERSFEYLREDIQERFSELFNDPLKHGEFYLHLTEKEFGDKENYWWITHGGPPFGYVSMCFDMEYEDPDATEKHPFYKIESLEDWDAENEN